MKASFLNPVPRSRFAGSKTKYLQCENQDSVPIDVAKNSPVSNHFLKDIRRGVQQLPVLLQQLARQRGYRILLGRFLTEAHPFLKQHSGAKCREGRTWDSTIGFHDSKEKLLVASEYCLKFTRPNKPPRKQSFYQRLAEITVDSFFRHEFGHIIDNHGRGKNHIKRHSYTKSFWRAYQKDTQKLTPKEKQTLDYFLQGSETDRRIKRGVCETFAEVVAACLGGGAMKPQFMLQKFPNTLHWIQGHVPVMKILMAKQG